MKKSITPGKLGGEWAHKKATGDSPIGLSWFEACLDIAAEYWVRIRLFLFKKKNKVFTAVSSNALSPSLYWAHEKKKKKKKKKGFYRGK